MFAESDDEEIEASTKSPEKSKKLQRGLSVDQSKQEAIKTAKDEEEVSIQYGLNNIINTYWVLLLIMKNLHVERQKNIFKRISIAQYAK